MPIFEQHLMKTRFILFDFDGVIVDSFAPAFEVNKMRCPSMSEDDYRRRFEGNINESSDTGFQHDSNCRHDIDFFSEYIPRMEKVPIVYGMDDVISRLSEDYNLIVISSTLTAPIGELLDRFHLKEYFIEIMGNDVHTSKVEKIKLVFEKYKTNPESCVFITDTLGDIKEATMMNVGAIGVSWGFNSREILMKGKPVEIVDRPEEIFHAVDRYFSR